MKSQSQKMRKHLSDLNYKAGEVASQLAALRFVFHGTNLVMNPTANEWAGFGDLLEKVLIDARAVMNGLDSVNFPSNDDESEN